MNSVWRCSNPPLWSRLRGYSWHTSISVSGITSIHYNLPAITTNAQQESSLWPYFWIASEFLVLYYTPYTRNGAASFCFHSITWSQMTPMTRAGSWTCWLEYRTAIESLIRKDQDKNLSLIVSKIKDLVIDFRKQGVYIPCQHQWCWSGHSEELQVQEIMSPATYPVTLMQVPRKHTDTLLPQKTRKFNVSNDMHFCRYTAETSY